MCVFGILLFPPKSHNPGDFVSQMNISHAIKMPGKCKIIHSQLLEHLVACCRLLSKSVQVWFTEFR